ncbi:hypothetical protein L227DRAFT_560964 [Lentinus tigrinus ALCF2SS1-6]|uniref:DUF6533 domain-containing protein n=1 Tax=Lentinus tigrinus ALCF2SS1-6 TaxID=1328759 RepID=A0A5C2SKT1_9APHY|nr:hypothetical protein L227DRAFT_560964 [Lentinus tigrinus ALCF2SS1-6]
MHRLSRTEDYGRDDEHDFQWTSTKVTRRPRTRVSVGSSPSTANLNWTSSALAILAYDYLLTFPREVRFVWNRRFSPATALFLVNRYTIILLYFVDFVTLFPIIPATCQGVGKFIVVLEIFPYIILAAFSGLRTYALSQRNTFIGLFTSLLSLVPAGINALTKAQYFLSTFTFVNLEPPSNCTAFSDITANLSKAANYHFFICNRLTIASRTSLIAADICVIAVTWWSTYGIRKLTRDARLETSFGTLLLRDGTIYFMSVHCAFGECVLLAMNVVHMTLNTVKPNNVVQQASYVTILENPIASVLVSRFILNLREVDQLGPGDASFDDTLPSFVNSQNQEGTLRFASRSFADEFSVPLDFDSMDGEDEELALQVASDSETRSGEVEIKETAMTSPASSTGLTLVSVQGSNSPAPHDPNVTLPYKWLT